MKYLHIKSLEKYHPGYKDRKLIWCKIYFSMLNSSPEFELLCEIDKWRFVAFIMLELQIQKPVPLDEKYLAMKGFDFKKRSMSSSLQMLQNLIDICEESLQNRNIDIEKSRVEKSTECVTSVTPHNEFIDVFCKQYEKTVGSKYVFKGGQDGKIVKELLKALPLGELIRRMELFFKSDDEWIKKAGRDLRIFSSQINKFGNTKKNEGKLIAI